MAQPLFEIRNLTYTRNKRKVLSVSNFEIHRGIIYAIAGPPGSGKTAFLDILAGVRKMDSGTLTYEGEEGTSMQVKRRYREEVYYLPQEPKRGRGEVKKYMLRNIRSTSWSNETGEQRLERIVKQMNLAERLTRNLKTLSPGERRWVELAIALASDTRVLIVDELEQHLGYDDLELVKRMIQRKGNAEGTTIIISTLTPMTIRRMTGVSVTLDRGRIAMIRSIREGTRPRRSDGRSRGNGRRRGGRGRGSRAPESANGKD